MSSLMSSNYAQIRLYKTGITLFVSAYGTAATNEGPNTSFSQLFTCIHQSAKAALGIIVPYKGSNYVQDNIVATLSQQQKQLRLQIESTTNATSQRALRRQRTNILRQNNCRLRAKLRLNMQIVLSKISIQPTTVGKCSKQ